MSTRTTDVPMNRHIPRIATGSVSCATSNLSPESTRRSVQLRTHVCNVATAGRDMAAEDPATSRSGAGTTQRNRRPDGSHCEHGDHDRSGGGALHGTDNGGCRAGVAHWSPQRTEGCRDARMKTPSGGPGSRSPLLSGPTWTVEGTSSRVAVRRAPGDDATLDPSP
jgi:hypothetical protein